MPACHTVKTGRQSLQTIPSQLLGRFQDDYGSSYSITHKQWVQNNTYKYHLIHYNKNENYFIARNDTANPADGGLYTRIDIAFFNNMEPWQWGYCLAAYKAGSEQEALQTPPADRQNPRKGCNGYPFSRMKRTQ